MRQLQDDLIFIVVAALDKECLELISKNLGERERVGSGLTDAHFFRAHDGLDDPIDNI